MRLACISRAPHCSHRGRFGVLVIVTSMLAIPACGSSGKTSTPAASGGPLLKLAECIRSHGVPNFPDPGGHGLVIPNNIDTQSPAFKSAQQACAKLGSTPIPGGPGQRAASESAKLRMLDLAKCMREHGLPNFPDPTTSPPPAPPPGSVHGNVVGVGGVYLQLPPRSLALTLAAAACNIP
jgi:hypothetical protein